MTTSLRRRNGLQRLLDKSGKVVAKRQPRTTVASRKAQLLDELDHKRYLELDQQMADFMSLITKPLGTEMVLDEDGKHLVMKQALAVRTIKELMDVCRDEIKRAFFGHLDALFEKDDSIESPENEPGEMLVPELGMRLARENCGRNDPAVDEDLLKVMLGDRWKEVYDAEVIPKHTEYTLSLEKLVTLALTDPDLHDQIVAAIEPGSWKSPRMALRPI